MLAEDFTEWLAGLTDFADAEDIVELQVPASFDDDDKYSVSVECPEGVPVASYGKVVQQENTLITAFIFGNKLSVVREKTRTLKDEFHNYNGALGNSHVVKSSMIAQNYQKPNPQTKLIQSTISFDVLTQPQ